MPDDNLRLHDLFVEGGADFPRLHALERRRACLATHTERVDLDRVVVTGRGDLSRGVERRMADTQSRLMLADQRG